MASRPDLREEDETGFCKFFRNIPEKNEETIRIFDRKEYYSVHGDDAVFVANTVSTKQNWNTKPVLSNCRYTKPLPSYGSWDENQASIL
jgi:hypothetical protein